MIEVELQWLLAFGFLLYVLGFISGHYAKYRQICQAMRKLNHFMNVIRGDDFAPVDNLRFLIEHLRDGGPEKLMEFFKMTAGAKDIMEESLRAFDDSEELLEALRSHKGRKST